MNIIIREIGNSKGIIIPVTALKEAGIDRIADMQVEKGRITLKAMKKPRAGWSEAIQKDPPDDYEDVFMDGLEDPDLEDDWVW